MEIQRTTIHQVYLLRLDEVPLLKLLHPAGLQPLSALFGFGQAGVVQDQSGTPVINLQLGAFREGELELPILRLAIEDRRILLDLEGPSDQADKVFARLAEHLRVLSGRADDAFLRPIVKAQESEVVCRLSFQWDRLLSHRLTDFVARNLHEATGSKHAASSAKLGQIMFVIQYETEGLALDDQRVSLSRKEFIIAPRPGYLPTERVYYSKAPVDTSSHLALLHELDSLFAEEPNRAGQR